MKKTVITLSAAALVALALASWQVPSSREQGEKNANFETLSQRFSLSAERLKAEEEKILAATSREKEREMRRAFLSISLEKSNEESELNLAKLAMGLESKNESVRGSTILLVQSLLIDVAHRSIKIDPALDESLNALFLIYKKRAQNQITKLQKASPKSPTINYLQQI